MFTVYEINLRAKLGHDYGHEKGWDDLKTQRRFELLSHYKKKASKYIRANNEKKLFIINEWKSKWLISFFIPY